MQEISFAESFFWDNQFSYCSCYDIHRHSIAFFLVKVVEKLNRMICMNSILFIVENLISSAREMGHINHHENFFPRVMHLLLSHIARTAVA